jgi:hypothetical protein
MLQNAALPASNPVACTGKDIFQAPHKEVSTDTGATMNLLSDSGQIPELPFTARPERQP